MVDEIDQLLEAPSVLPNPFTPNGDGINDEVVFSFDLFLVLNQVDVSLGIYDLSGRAVRHLDTVKGNAGTIRIGWDGNDENGAKVAPGIYLYYLKIGSDDSASEHSGTISLVY